MNTDNNAKCPRISFQDLKARVGIDDVAYSLGYRLDRRAGVGRYFELVLGDSRQKQDTIIVRNTGNKATQTFFRRNGEKGDVVTLVRENINSFNVDGKNEWHKIIKVLSKFANMPVQDYREDFERLSPVSNSSGFDASRYDTKQVDTGKVHRLLQQRGFNIETVRRFAPFIHLISDRNNHNFSGFNIGFPYTSFCKEGVAGYEIRGFNGFKSKAAGTDSSSSAWIADFSMGNRSMVKNVYFFESAFDAMAFWQMNSRTLPDDIALVSLGGTFSDNQVLGVIDAFPNARMNDCFDNDIAGRINAVRLLGLCEKIPVAFQQRQDALVVMMRGKSIEFDSSISINDCIGRLTDLTSGIGQWLPPKDFKDWNDCLLHKTGNYSITTSKYDRNENLLNQRKSSLKI